MCLKRRKALQCPPCAFTSVFDGIQLGWLMSREGTYLAQIIATENTTDFTPKWVVNRTGSHGKSVTFPGFQPKVGEISMPHSLPLRIGLGVLESMIDFPALFPFGGICDRFFWRVVEHVCDNGMIPWIILDQCRRKAKKTVAWISCDGSEQVLSW